ncbi:AMP-binding protein, partial [Hydrogenimonas sp.]
MEKREKEWIEKDIGSLPVEPNLLDYDEVYRAFSWEDVGKRFDGLPSGGLNIAHEAIDRHADGALGDKTALVWYGKSGERKTFTYRDLKTETNRFANVIKSLGLEKGDRVYILSPRVPELYIAVMGILKNRSVMCPLFAQFGPEPILQRMQGGDAKALVTTERLYDKKVSQIVDRLPDLKYVFLIDAEAHRDEKILSLPRLMEEASEDFEILPTDPEDMSLLHFTSGTTGKPKGVIHVHKAI